MPLDRKFKHAQCGKTATWFEGVDSGLKYARVLSCYDRLCPKCGNKGGQIHKRRNRRILDKIKRGCGSLDGLSFRKFVFTLPLSVRDSMRDKKALNHFFIDVADILKPLFPGRQIFLSLHLFGDRDQIYKPHVNAYVVERRNTPGGCSLRLSRDVLASIKDSHVSALIKRGFNVDVADVHYSFTLDKAHFLHGVKYFARPCPDEKILSDLEFSDPELYEFLMSDEMKRFQFIRSLKMKVDENQYLEGVPVIRFEKMRYLGRSPFVWSNFVNDYRVFERMEIFPGFYAIRSGGLLDRDRAMFAGAGDG